MTAKKEETDLDVKYREEGWGNLAAEALGIRPQDVESQAREVARFAQGRIDDLQSKVTLLENGLNQAVAQLRHQVLTVEQARVATARELLNAQTLLNELQIFFAECAVVGISAPLTITREGLVNHFGDPRAPREEG